MAAPVPEPAIPGSRDAPLGRRALRGGAVSVGGHVLSNAIRLGSNLILTRLLLPEHFGLAALVTVVLTGLHMLSDVGVGAALIQHARGDEPTFHRTAFTIQVVRGLFLACVCVAIAWPMAAFYELPDLAWMLPIAAGAPLIEGFASTKVFRQTRHLRLDRVIVIDILAHVASVSAMAIVAWHTRHVAALLVGGIAAALLRVALSHLWLPGTRDGFGWDAESRRALVQFGRWVLVSTAITFVSLQIDRLMLGRLVTPDVLGTYSIAVTLALAPREVVGRLTFQVAYPLVARLLEGSDAATAIRTLRVRALAVLAVPVGVFVGASGAVFRLLYDARYAGGGSIVALVGIGTWLNIVGMSYVVVALARGWPRWISYANGLKAITFAALAVPVHTAYGIQGIALLVATAEVVVSMVTGFGVRRLGMTSAGIDVGATLVMLAAAGLTYAAEGWLASALGSSWPGVILFGAVGALALYAGAKRVSRDGTARVAGTEPEARAVGG